MKKEGVIIEVQNYIDLYNLKQPNRNRYFVYRRAYLYYILKSNGYTLIEISKLFNKTHATIINGHKVHNSMIDTKDKEYLFETLEMRERFHLHTDYIPLREMVLLCENEYDLHKLKEKIILELY